MKNKNGGQMNILNQVDLIRIVANSKLDQSSKGELGQFYTNAPISLFMASLFTEIKGDVKLLDPGCGPCSLTAAFADEAIQRSNINSLEMDVFEIEKQIEGDVKLSIEICKSNAEKAKIKCKSNIIIDDFIIKKMTDIAMGGTQEKYTHVIMNPPYKKISNSGVHRSALRNLGIETVNLYSGFLALAIKLLKKRGELVAIIPRSFCNGPYYLPFRKMILEETALKHIHVFDSRRQAFSEDKVLQENVIIHLEKGAKQKEVVITSSPIADFSFDEKTKSITATDKTIRIVNFNKIVNSEDGQKFIHIAANDRDQAIVDKLSVFTASLKEIEVEVSTGPVVDFRLKKDLRDEIEVGAVPLIYPSHLNGGVCWPKQSKKPNAIVVSEDSKRWLWSHKGFFLIVRRFSSKEEKRRIVASIYDSSLPEDLIGFDNKLNVFHFNKTGFNEETALGLYVYLNSTLLDKYYRLFSGHTQVNATDLRNINYPSIESLKRMGIEMRDSEKTQKKIDDILDKEICSMTGENNKNPLEDDDKITQTLEILSSLGMPRQQQNERSALTFLALLNLSPNQGWAEVESPLMGVTPIMDWCRAEYGKEYAPNTRETFRRQSLHQFVDGGLCLYNPDEPDRSVNSPKACYQIAPELFDVISHYGTDKWDGLLSGWLKIRKTLAAQYAKKREMEMIPLTLDDGTEIKLSPGIHSQLIHDIVTEFGPRFAPGSEVIYIGDTGAKEDFFRNERLAELGVMVDRKGKLPDVVLYLPEKNWLLLIESVTSHGPVDGKRFGELSQLFKEATPGIVYVTAFPDRRVMARYITEISWETEVWTSDAPTHMIHFNGDRFLGPHQ